MNNFIFKSANRLIKNSPITLEYVIHEIRVVQKQERLLREDLINVNGKLDRLLVDKHLQMQVDNYFDNKNDVHPEDTRDLD